MEVEKRKIEIEKKDNEIIYSKAIKAGKRIYYLDVKKSRNEDLFLAITESKKKFNGSEEDAQVTYEKHKIIPKYLKPYNMLTHNMKYRMVMIIIPLKHLSSSSNFWGM